MELDERLRWIETRVTSSLKPRAEELKHLFTNDDCRAAMFEFCNNEDIKNLYIFSSTDQGGGLTASLTPPNTVREKAMFFVKSQGISKVTRDNIIEDVAFCDCSNKPLDYLGTLTRDVYLPLLSIEMGGSVSSDKLMDLLHRLVANLEVSVGTVKDEVVLPLPSIEVLSEAAAYSNRRPAVIHVLETAVINWIKQIKGILKLDPELEIAKRFGAKPLPLDEIEMWSEHLEKTNHISEQLCSHVALNIIMNLEDAHSTYSQSIHLVKREITKAETESNDNLQFLSTLLPWFERLHYATTSKEMTSLFAPLMHTLYLVWAHSRYYHENKNFKRLLTMLSNEIVARARYLVGENVLENLTESYTSLKDALRICAAFRGCYLDKKDKADELNQTKLSQQIGTNVDSGGVVWHSKLFNDSITPKAGKLFNKSDHLDSMTDIGTDVWTDSPWPLRNHACFIRLNNFMERCNDVLELVQTTRHFELLTCAAEVGGAGGDGLDCLVKEINEKFKHAVQSFKQMTQDVLDTNESRQFERDFFSFRSVTRDLEFNLADVLRQSFKQCWDTRAKLRLLEVFEGISGRDLVQANLRDIFSNMVNGFREELIKVKTFFEQHTDSPPSHAHLPPVASKVLWLRGLKLHIQEPMSRLTRVSPMSLKGDDGWRLRDTYTDLLHDIEESESETLRKWQNDMQTELRIKLKQPLLIADVNSTSKTPMLQVNFDPDLLLLLREIHYLASPPFNVRLPDSVRILLRSTDNGLLRSTAARLDTIVTRYNSITASMEEFEKPLFEQKMAKIEELLNQGLHDYSWKTIESADFVEHASFLVCDDVHYNLGIVQSNFKEICNIAGLWSAGNQLDVFTSCDAVTTYPMDKLNAQHRDIYEAHKNNIIIGGNRIHALLQSTFEAVQISRASPSWQSYTEYVSNVVLSGLQDSTLTSLQSMLNQIVHSNLTQDPLAVPILTIRLELTGLEVMFSPTLDNQSASNSVQESVYAWLQDFLDRGHLVSPVDSKRKTYKTAIAEDSQIQRLVKQITEVVDQNAEECKGFLATFREYAFLWMQDVQRTFEAFLEGNIVAHPRKMNRSENIRSRASQHSEKSKNKDKDVRSSSRTSGAASTLSTSGAMGLSEKTFLNTKKLKLSSLKEVKEDKGPSLDDFDKEIEIYETARDEIIALQDWCDVGWMRVNMSPIKQVLGTYASKWMFVYTKYLSDQVSTTLNDLDSFLKRIEPGIEAITGQEQDIASFMRLMRVFNEVSTQQAEMDSKFVAMKRTIALLERYGQKLPEMTQKFYTAAPQRWNNLKMKVNKAKQRLGPRIQAEERRVTNELKVFGDRCEALSRQFASSEVFHRRCAIYGAFTLIDAFSKKLQVLESEAQDLIELQELFEKVVVNFSVLPRLRSDLECLRQVWKTNRAIQEQHTEWKRGRWQRINTRLMRKATDAQLEVVHGLPSDSQEWDVYLGIEDSIWDIQACLPIIDDLSKSAMRPRHWKQLLRLTGGSVQINNEGLTRMTLGQLLDLGLHNHAEEVRGIIQRASKDVAIESSLKTYEEVWLSKIFEIRPHTGYKRPNSPTAVMAQDNTGSEFGKDSEYEMHGVRGLSSRISVTSHGSGGFSIKDSKTRKTSIASATFSQSLLTLTQDNGPVCLLDHCDPIFEELEDHQVSLQHMLNGSSAGSFADDIMKWQKRLQTIEAVLTVWLEVQEKWIELEDVFTSLEFRIAMPHETNLFSAVNRDFRILMKATEKNPNVLQACSRTNIQTKLEKLKMNLQQCWKSLLTHLERRRQKFPRFYFLSCEDVLHVVCNGYDPGLVNPYLNKVLDNLGCLDYEECEVEGIRCFQINGVVSSHGEKLQIKTPVLCEGPIDGWLSNVVNILRQTLSDQLAANIASKSSSSDVIAPAEEIKSLLSNSNCCQVVLLGLQIELCKTIEDAVTKRESTGDTAPITAVLDRIIAVITALNEALRDNDYKNISVASEEKEKFPVEGRTGDVRPEGMSRTTSASLERVGSAALGSEAGRSDMSRTSIKGNKPDVQQEPQPEEKQTTTTAHTPSDIQRITNIITYLSHTRDLVQQLEDQPDVTSVENWFNWFVHARHSWEDEKQSCKVDIVNMSFDYGFEYQGTSSRLVNSPATDRCLMGLAHALNSKQVGLCTGPSGCGKTNTIRELSYILGYPLYIFNSSKHLSRSMLVDICRGMASSGSWVCFTNISAVTPVVMQILTHLLSAIYDGLRANKSTVLLHDEEVPLVAQGACFGTLTNSINDTSPYYNPSIGFFSSFKGSTVHITMNQQAVFRPVALMGPNWDIMLEVWLLSHGFTHVRTLASKIASLRDICLKMLPNTSKTLSGDIFRCVHKCSSWGLVSLERIIKNAGSHLSTCREELETNTAVGKPPDRVSPIGREPSPTDFVAAANEPAVEDTGNESTMTDDLNTLKAEEYAVVLALRDTFIPQLANSDAVMFATLVSDLFPSGQIPMIFDSYGVVEGKMALNQSISNLDEIPVSPRPGSPAVEEKVEVLEDIHSAIQVATSKLGLQPGISFQSRVVQLSELIKTHQVVCVTGPPGCGKTETIRTLAAAHREMGYQVKSDIICTGTLESEELLGYADPVTKEWKNGLLPIALRKHLRILRDTSEKSPGKPLIKWLHLDGTIDPVQMEIFGSFIKNNGTVVLGNNEHLKLPPALRIIWELESLDNLSPAVLSSVGMLALSSADVNWPLLVERWLSRRSEREVGVLRDLCNRYIAPTLEYLASTTTVPPNKGAPPGQDKPSQLRHVVPINEMGMVTTLLTLVEAIIANYQDLMPSEFENYFCYAAMWAFGGTLEVRHKKYFSNWWRKQWTDYVILPGDDEVWNFYVNPETHEFLNWRDAVPPYSQTAAEGIPNESYVHTVNNERISHLVSLLADAGKPVLLVGDQGSGKTSILRHRLNQHGGDMGEVLSLTVHCNKFTTGRSLWHEVSNCLEWKHAHTYVPKGNKSLTCLVDDLNLSKASATNIQSACELVRQHIDHGGVFDPETQQWKEVHQLTYLSSYDPNLPPTTPKLSNRLLRHFSVFSVSFPSISELHDIYTQQLEKHFLVNITQTQSNANDTASQQSDESNVKHTGIGFHDRSMKELLSNLTYVTLEMQDNLRTMYLPTSQRCHYMFTMTDMTMVFRNLCLTLRPGCSHDDLLLLWKHECDWVYSRRLIDAVDKERYQQAFMVAAKKRFANEEQLSIVSRPTPFFTNLIDLEDNSGEGISGGSTDVNEDDVHLAYRHVTDMNKVRAVLEHGIDEYNKDFPRLKIKLHNDVMETICRLVRVIQSPHECGHAMIVSEGSPGLATKLAQLAAHLCDYSVFRINVTSLSANDKYTLDKFKADLVQAFTRAGVKGEHLLLLLPESDIFNEDFLVHVSEFLVSCSISHLFTEEEQTSVINAVRSEVTQAGLTYTKDVAWDFFLKTVRENLRVIMTCTSLGEAFQKRCRALPALTNTVSIILMPHWSKEGLVSHASYHLKNLSIFNSIEKENLAHLMASMHLALRHQEGCDVEAGRYSHLTNTTYEIFVEKFIDLVTQRQRTLVMEYEQVEAALKTIGRGVNLAEELKKQLEHEKMVLDQKKKGNEQLLMQIGQDRAIAEEQVRLVKKQHERIQKLKKALPEYQMAHERAVYKAAAVVSDTKRVLKTLDQQGLTELRAMQKPDSEIEDLLAAIIFIVKSPSSDITWNKGAKRLMANLDRFREDLAVFDDNVLPPSTLEVVEPYLKRPHFNGDYMERKTNNPAVGSLVQWVRGVVRYHRMMQSKVKPLHAKVAETSSTEATALEKMTTMNDKLSGLEDRLKALAVAYEDASIDKCRQYELTQNLDTKLKQAAYFEQVLSSGRQKWSNVQASIKKRIDALAGGVAIAAAFATYLGPYGFAFRQAMMTKHWPRCLEERGVPLVLDASPPYPDARVFTSEGLSRTESDQSEKQQIEGERDEGDGNVDGQVRDKGDGYDTGLTAGEVTKDENSNYEEAPTVQDDSNEEANQADASELPENNNQGRTSRTSQISKTSSGTSRKISDTSQGKEHMEKSLIEYDAFSLAIAKLLLGDGPVRKLLTKGLGLRKIENAVLAKSSWQRVPLLIDPNNKSLEMIRMLEKGSKLLEVDLGESDQSTVMQIEKAINSGTVLVLYNIGQQIDSLLMPLIHHINTAVPDKPFKDVQIVKFGSRRVTCSPKFRLYLVSRASEPVFSTEVASITTLINFELRDQGLGEELALEAFARVRPELYIEGRKCLLAVVELLKILEDVDSKLMNRIMTKEGTSIWDETELIAELVQCRTEVTHRLLKAMKNLERLSTIRSQFRALANRGVVLFTLMKDLCKVQHEYRFSLGYFMGLFKEAVGKDFEIPEGERLEYEDDEEEQEDGEQSRINSYTSVVIKMNDADHDKVEGRTSSGSIGVSKKTSVILPSEVELPTPSVEYKGLTDEETGLLQAALTKSFYSNVSRSMYEHHRLMFATLVYLILRKEKNDKVMEILLTTGKGMLHGVSLSDFDPTLVKPSWISSSIWDSILTMSSLPGSLEGICAQIAADPNAWRQWCNSVTPENQQIPIKQGAKPLNVFDKLLMIRCLRPDRFKGAMKVTVVQSLSQLIEATPPSFSDIVSSIPHSVPVFVFLPQQNLLKQSNVETPIAIRKLAESQNVTCNCVSVGQDEDSLIDVALATAVRTDSWLVIDNLHLATSDWLNQLYNRLLRLHLKAPLSQSQWRVFLLSEPSPHLPEILLLFSHQLAWDVVQRQDRYQYLSVEGIDLKETIIQTLQAVPPECWTTVREQSLPIRTAIFGLCVLHSILILRQQCGTRALSGYYPFSISDVTSGIDMITDKAFTSQQDGQTIVDGARLSQAVYAGKVVDQWDQRYISTLSNKIFQAKASTIELGPIKIPLPPINVEPEDYSQWFIEKTNDENWAVNTVLALTLQYSVQRELGEASADQFFKQLSTMLLPGITSAKGSQPMLCLSTGRPIKMAAVRQAMDLCLDKLPNLLKYETNDVVLFNRLSPRVFSQLRALSQYSESSSVSSLGSERLSETMGYALQKECEWFNCQLHHVRHQLQTLEQCVLAGVAAIPSSLNKTVSSLENEQVPLSWQHPNNQPTPHSLATWFHDFQLRHKQLKTLIQEGVVPKVYSDPVLGKGRLKSIWLGGLANPGAIITSLKHEKAAVSDCSVNEVTLQCSIYDKSILRDSTAEEDDGIVLTGLCLEGAVLEPENESLKLSSCAFCPLPDIVVRAVMYSDLDHSNSNGDEPAPLPLYNCPVYMTRSRQTCSFTIPLKSSDEPEELTLSGVAMVMNCGDIKGTWKLEPSPSPDAPTE